jgi:uncharacterized protein (DUF1778 family)
MSRNYVIQINTPSETKNLIERAAALSGATVSTFAIQAALREAEALLLPDVTVLLAAVSEESSESA